MGIISEMLSYPFMVRALIGGLFSLSLRLSAGGQPGAQTLLNDWRRFIPCFVRILSIALAAGWSPLKVSIPVVVLAAFFLLRITEHGKVKSDAAIAMISASALAIGIIVTS